MVANQGSCGVAEGSSHSESNLNGNSTEVGEKHGVSGINKEPVKVLTLSTTNPHILAFRAMEYAARGPVITRAISLEQELALMKQVNKHILSYFTRKRPKTLLLFVLRFVIYFEILNYFYFILYLQTFVF
jgi:hypothetical protein